MDQLPSSSSPLLSSSSTTTGNGERYGGVGSNAGKRQRKKLVHQTSLDLGSDGYQIPGSVSPVQPADSQTDLTAAVQASQQVSFVL